MKNYCPLLLVSLVSFCLLSAITASPRGRHQHHRHHWSPQHHRARHGELHRHYLHQRASAAAAAAAGQRPDSFQLVPTDPWLAAAGPRRRVHWPVAVVSTGRWPVAQAGVGVSTGRWPVAQAGVGVSTGRWPVAQAGVGAGRWPVAEAGGGAVADRWPLVWSGVVDNGDPWWSMAGGRDRRPPATVGRREFGGGHRGSCHHGRRHGSRQHPTFDWPLFPILPTDPSVDSSESEEDTAITAGESSASEEDSTGSEESADSDETTAQSANDSQDSDENTNREVTTSDSSESDESEEATNPSSQFPEVEDTNQVAVKPATPENSSTIPTDEPANNAEESTEDVLDSEKAGHIPDKKTTTPPEGRPIETSTTAATTETTLKPTGVTVSRPGEKEGDCAEGALFLDGKCICRDPTMHIDTILSRCISSQVIIY